MTVAIQFLPRHGAGSRVDERVPRRDPGRGSQAGTQSGSPSAAGVKFRRESAGCGRLPTEATEDAKQFSAACWNDSADGYLGAGTCDY